MQTLYGAERPVCPACGWVHFADPKVAAAVFVERAGQVLLVQRAMEPHAGEWGVPAGFVDAWEDPARAAERECLEETGLQVRVTGLIDVIAGREHPRGADILIAYRAEVVAGELRAGDDASRAAFFSRDDLPPLAFRATSLLLEIEPGDTKPVQPF
jgi:ADP-ribose pyrophosphatase YjhB (NUDIX family)